MISRNARYRLSTTPESAFVFVSERASPFSPAGFAKLIERDGRLAHFLLQSA
jgi:hypothetical protein